VFATNLILLAPLLLMAKRWRLPFGVATTLFTTVALFTSAIEEFSTPWLIGAALVAGLASDLVRCWLRPSAERHQAYWATGLVTPLLLWTAWFAAGLTGGIGWSLEVWPGRSCGRD
jgi:hypothetical protein